MTKYFFLLVVLCCSAVGVRAMEKEASEDVKLTAKAPSPIIEITKERALMLEFPGIMVVDCFGDQCPPCKMMAPIFEEVAQEFSKDYAFAKIDTEKEQELAQKLEIDSIPTFAVIKMGKVIGKLVGFMPKEKFIEKLKEILEGPTDLSQFTKDQLNERLMDAVKFGDGKEIKKYIDAGAEPRTIKYDKNTPPIMFYTLMNISKSGDEKSLEVLKMLLDAGVQLEYSIAEDPTVYKAGDQARQMADRFRKISELYGKAERLIKEHEDRLKK